MIIFKGNYCEEFGLLQVKCTKLLKDLGILKKKL